MIRLAAYADFPPATNEVLVRIHGLYRAYGASVPFIHYYTDGTGALLSLMDGVALFHIDSLTAEWSIFLQMHPDIEQIHCDAAIGNRLMQTGFWRGREGVTMRLCAAAAEEPLPCEAQQPRLEAVYALLQAHFPVVPRFDAWYTDVSHRLRHGCSHLAALVEDGSVVSTAMTVCETETAAVLGQVVTHPDFRRRGMAKTCLNQLISRCKGKTLYILPLNKSAEKLYQRLGFARGGAWAELERI